MRLLPGLVLALVLSAAFADVLVGGRTLSTAAYLPGAAPTGPVQLPAAPRPSGTRDHEGAAWVGEPAPRVISAALRAQGLPLWNPDEGLGMPLAGNPNMGVWSPLQLPVNLFPGPGMQDAAWLLRLFLAGVFTFGLARALGLEVPGAMVAGLGLMLSGQMVEWVAHHPLHTDTFVPLALCAALGVVRGRAHAMVVLAVAVAAAVSALKPQSGIVAVVTGATWIFAGDFRGEHRASARSLPRLIGAGGLGLGLAGIALIPFVETYLDASGLVHAGRATQSSVRLAGETVAALLGPVGRGMLETPPPLAARPPYVGVAIALLALVGAWVGRRAFLTWVLVGTVLFYGLKIFTGWPDVGGLPVLGQINFVKYCFPAYLALSLLAGRAVPSSRRGWVAAIVVAVELVWLAQVPRPLRVDPFEAPTWLTEVRQGPGTLSGGFRWVPPMVSSALGVRDVRTINVLTPGPTYRLVSETIAPSQGIAWLLADPDPLLAATSPGGPGANLRWIASSAELDRERLAGAVRSRIAGRRLRRLFEVTRHHEVSSRLVSAGIQDRSGDRRFHWTCETPCVLSFDLKEAPRRLAVGLAAEERQIVSLSIRAGDREDPARARFDARIALVPTSWDDRWLDGIPAGATRIEVAIDADRPTRVLLGGVGPSPGKQSEFQRWARELEARRAALDGLRVARAGDPFLYEDPRARGEVWTAERVESYGEPEEPGDLLGCLLAPGPEAVACLPGDDFAAADHERRALRTVSLRESGPTTATVETSGQAPGLLVFARAWHRGWTAEVDGAASTPVPANGGLVAVRVPAGDHRVELRWTSRSTQVGACLTILSILGLWLVIRRVSDRPFEGQEEPG